MPNCEYFEELCSASLDGKLTRAQKRELDAHLAECPACAAYLEDLKLLRTAWGDLKEPLPEELHEKIMGGIMAEANKKVVPMEKKKRRPPVFTMIAAAAACVMLAVSGVFSNLGGGGQANTAAPAGGAAMEDTAEPSDAAAPETPDSSAAASETPDTVAPSVLLPAQSAEPEPQPESRTGSGSAASSSGESSAQEKTDAAAPRQAQAGASAQTEPQINVMRVNRAEFQSISLPDNLQTHRFALCYVAVGSGETPALQDATLLEKIDNVYYFELTGGMSSVEADIQTLQQSGFETATRQDIGVTIDENAESVLLIVVIEG